MSYNIRKYQLAVLISGSGSNLQALIDWCKDVDHMVEISVVISNNPDAYGLTRAKQAGIPTEVCETNGVSVDEQEKQLYEKLLNHYPDIIVLAGYMRVLTKKFLNVVKATFDVPVINLHPALPGEYVGKDCIEAFYHDYIRGIKNHSGVMVHHVIPEVDKGDPIAFTEYWPSVAYTPPQDYLNPQNYPDPLTLDEMKDEFHEVEHILLIKAVEKLLKEHNFYHCRRGKVREMFNVSDNMLCMFHSDRLSAFDRNICNITGKGIVLCETSAWWFQKTKDIIDNHYLFHKGRSMLVKKCKTIPIEVVVRGYITGNTETSLWTHYKNGARTYTGNVFPDGLTKNQKLYKPVVTPTTKSELGDKPISGAEIVSKGILTEEEWKYIEQKALELFNYGTKVSSEQGLILVDTKYEFGKVSAGSSTKNSSPEEKIILIDELHTCDSSRFWLKDTYLHKFFSKEEPDKYDKDIIRNYIKKQGIDPYNEDIPAIDSSLKQQVQDAYTQFYTKLTDKTICLHDTDITNNLYSTQTMIDVFYNLVDEETKYERVFEDRGKCMVVIIAGSTSDKDHVYKIINALDSHEIDYLDPVYISAHKNIHKLLDYLEELKALRDSSDLPYRKVFVTVAGRSNALSGVIAGNVKEPVIACPPFKDKMDYSVNIHSSLQMPSNIPVMTVLEPVNVAMAIERIFGLTKSDY